MDKVLLVDDDVSERVRASPLQPANRPRNTAHLPQFPSKHVQVSGFVSRIREALKGSIHVIGFPAAAIEEQAKGEPNSDILDAMNEVTNTE